MSSVGTPSTPSIQWQCHRLNWWNKNLWNILKWIRTLEDWNNIEKWFMQNYSLSENLSWQQLIQEPFGRSVRTCAKIKIFDDPFDRGEILGRGDVSNNLLFKQCDILELWLYNKIIWWHTMNNIGPTITAQSRPGASDLGIKTKESNYEFLLL